MTTSLVLRATRTLAISLPIASTLVMSYSVWILAMDFLEDISQKLIVLLLDCSKIFLPSSIFTNEVDEEETELILCCDP